MLLLFIFYDGEHRPATILCTVNNNKHCYFKFNQTGEANLIKTVNGCRPLTISQLNSSLVQFSLRKFDAVFPSSERSNSENAVGEKYFN